MLRSLRKLTDRLGRAGGQARVAPRAGRYAVLSPPFSTRSVFVKIYRHSARLEFDRGQALHEAGRRTGVFGAPRPLELVESQQLIVWEFNAGLVELRQHFSAAVTRGTSPQGRVELFVHIGQALAVVHASLSAMPTRGAYDPIRSVRSPNERLNRHVLDALAAGPAVVPHWDFACGNLFVREATAAPALVVLDPMPNSYIMPEYFSEPEFGSNLTSSPYVDAAQLIFSGSGHPRFAEWFAPEQEACLAAFLRGYREGGGAPLEPSVVWACAGELTARYQDHVDRQGASNGGAAKRDRRFRQRAADELFGLAARELARDEPGGR